MSHCSRLPPAFVDRPFGSAKVTTCKLSKKLRWVSTPSLLLAMSVISGGLGR